MCKSLSARNRPLRIDSARMLTTVGVFLPSVRNVMHESGARSAFENGGKSLPIKKRREPRSASGFRMNVRYNSLLLFSPPPTKSVEAL